MAILVEFFGIPRIRAGVDRLSVLDGRDSAPLGDVLREVGEQLPEFAASCLLKNRLREEYVASIDGECFVTSEQTTVLSDQSVLLLSADAGG